VLVAGLSPALLVGCGDVTERSEPAWFTDRPPLPACGEVVLDQGELVPGAAAECPFAGNAASGAELMVRSPTTERDPIYTYYRRLPRVVGLDVTSGATHDENGVDGWQWETCPDATSLIDVGECTTRAVGPR